VLRATVLRFSVARYPFAQSASPQAIYSSIHTTLTHGNPRSVGTIVPVPWGLPMHGIEQPFVAGDQRRAGLLRQRQVGRIVRSAAPAAAAPGLSGAAGQLRVRAGRPGLAPGFHPGKRRSGPRFCVTICAKSDIQNALHIKSETHRRDVRNSFLYPLHPLLIPLKRSFFLL